MAVRDVIADLPLTETEWQKQVTDLMRYTGWTFLHVRKSIGKGKKWATTTNLVGWCDLLAWHPRRGFVALELKVGKNKATPEQEAVLRSLAAAGASVMVAYPSDLEAVKRMLLAEPSYS